MTDVSAAACRRKLRKKCLCQCSFFISFYLSSSHTMQVVNFVGLVRQSFHVRITFALRFDFSPVDFCKRKFKLEAAVESITILFVEPTCFCTKHQFAFWLGYSKRFVAFELISFLRWTTKISI